jgi:hypothetical protein
MATLNALARYAGFEGWRDLLANAATPLPVISPSPAVAPSPATPPDPTAPAMQAAPASRATPATRRSYLFLAPLIILAALLSFISARLIHKPSGSASLRFEHHRTSTDLPNSVVFDYDASPLHPATVMIQQSWDPTRRDSVDPRGNQHTSIYYYPGYFNAKLIVDGEIKKQSDVYIPTKGWKTIISHDPLPVYLSPAETTLDSGRMGISARTLEAKTGSSVFNNRWVAFFDVREFPGTSGDHFLLKTMVRNTSTVEQSLCRNVRITIMGKQNPIMIPMADSGCVSSLGLYTGSAAISGKNHDLSAFGCTGNQWEELVCAQDKGTLNIWLNGRLAITVPGNKSIGDIVGLCIAFEGTGEIKEVTLKGAGEAADLLKHP